MEHLLGEESREAGLLVLCHLGPGSEQTGMKSPCVFVFLLASP